MPKVKKRLKNKFETKIVHGRCEGCELDTLLVCLDNTFYRCISCGEDLEQKVNGVIKYIKVDRNTDLNKSHSG
jgi:ribosomal protein S27E